MFLLLLLLPWLLRLLRPQPCVHAVTVITSICFTVSLLFVFVFVCLFAAAGVCCKRCSSFNLIHSNTYSDWNEQRDPNEWEKVRERGRCQWFLYHYFSGFSNAIDSYFLRFLYHFICFLGCPAMDKNSEILRVIFSFIHSYEIFHRFNDFGLLHETKLQTNGRKSWKLEQQQQQLQ